MASSSSLRMLSSNLKKVHTLVSRSRFATRSVHKRRALLYPVEDGVGHFLPPEALKTAVEWQEGLLERLNEEVKGTENQNKSVTQTVINTATARERTLAFNYASLALNNSFFLDNIKPPPVTADNHEDQISNDLLAAITTQHGSLRQLKSSFSAAGLGMFTNGWVWFVSDSKGITGILPTFGPGTLLVQSRTYMGHEKGLHFGDIVPLGRSTQASPTPKTPLSGTFPSSPASGVSSPTSPRLNDPNARLIHSSALAQREILTQPASLYGATATGQGLGTLSSIMNVGETIFPLFCVPVYEHSWMSAGYGVWGKENWLKEFWSVVDWKKASDAYFAAKRSSERLTDGAAR
ncbi:hypothetical protein FA13DRAFT_1728284 [Coprinellus micaceus]|uniref:Manganese/iron superoxide dismutase C-terminal domain-containing protein n=1 Tax=Coprinellus micaceus TaxID=71717 RepID=A0A4Y7TMQ3_COPMI|nr:hypothetical protein FA13DRAFT_1728284 [Coprinellus micaceus]